MSPYSFHIQFKQNLLIGGKWAMSSRMAQNKNDLNKSDHVCSNISLPTCVFWFLLITSWKLHRVKVCSSGVQLCWNHALLNVKHANTRTAPILAYRNLCHPAIGNQRPPWEESTMYGAFNVFKKRCPNSQQQKLTGKQTCETKCCLHFVHDPQLTSKHSQQRKGSFFLIHFRFQASSWYGPYASPILSGPLTSCTSYGESNVLLEDLTQQVNAL